MSKYGSEFRKFNIWFRANKHLLFCEGACYQGRVEAPAWVAHHIVRAGKRFSDNPHFWILLCKTCHWYCRAAKQEFEFARLIEWEEEWLKEKSVYRWMYEGRNKEFPKTETPMNKGQNASRPRDG